MAMDPVIKAKWVKALRSGRYKQGVGALYDPDSGRYCCLGVLCRVARAKEQDGVFEWKDPRLCNELNLPSDLKRKLGITSAEEGKLVKMNDGDPDKRWSLGEPFKSFPEIADYVEQRL